MMWNDASGLPARVRILYSYDVDDRRIDRIVLCARQNSGCTIYEHDIAISQ